ncbi:hypothetical protein ACIP3U_32250 [[Kitasatospora] papulosa]|uniref:hypothetical protein n=1 Tax=[Kitasatospora] papulosa TaxID=1464011 RepID=UPI0037F36919
MALSVVHITSEGDEYTGPLYQIGGKGAFTRRADTRLLTGGLEATIACVKDLPGPHDRLPGIRRGPAPRGRRRRPDHPRGRSPSPGYPPARGSAPARPAAPLCCAPSTPS